MNPINEVFIVILRKFQCEVQWTQIVSHYMVAYRLLCSQDTIATSLNQSDSGGQSLSPFHTQWTDQSVPVRYAFRIPVFTISENRSSY